MLGHKNTVGNLKQLNAHYVYRRIEMMENNDSILISLMEPVGILKQRFKEFAIFNLEHNRLVSNQSNMLDYDGCEFISLMIHEIFNQQNDTEGLGYLPPSTLLLMRHGLPKDIANKTASEVFNAIVDAITTFVPNAFFNSDNEYRYTLCNECDLFVSPPYQDTIAKLKIEENIGFE